MVLYSGNLLTWIRSFLAGRQQCMDLSGSAWLLMDECYKWVPKGSVLGPLLFILYANDKTDRLQSTLEMFVDDSKLYRIIETPRDIEIL